MSFWNNQPVQRDITQTLDSIIDPTVLDNPPQYNIKLLPGFEWCEITPDELKSFLDEQYYYSYSKNLIESLMVNNLFNVGVKVNGRIVGSIIGTPMRIRVRQNVISVLSINFLCVHQKLRGKRLAPVLIKEISIRARHDGIMYAIYTGPRDLHTSICDVRYYHRPLDMPRLIQCGMCDQSECDHPLPPTTYSKWQEAENEVDIRYITSLLSETKGDLQRIWTHSEVQRELVNGGDGMHTFVSESGFISFYGMKSKIGVDIATLYAYHVVEPGNLQQLLTDALILAKQLGYHVMNAFDIGDHLELLNTLKFTRGTGLLSYYLYNFNCRSIDNLDVNLVMI